MEQNQKQTLHIPPLKVRSHQTRMKGYVQMIYMLSQCKDAIDNPAALFANGANYTVRIEHLGCFTRHSREQRKLKNLNLDGYSHRFIQSEACSSSDVITSGGRKSETTMEDKVIVVVCGYPAQMARISHANEASKLKMFKRPTTRE